MAVYFELITIMKNPYSLIAFFALAGLILWINISHIPNIFFGYDVFGYYMHLPAFFTMNDVTLSDFSAVEKIVDIHNNTPNFYQFITLENGNHYNIYQVGMAVLYLPFFIIGYWIALVYGFPTDGFSAPYQYAVLYGSIVYTFIGLWFFRKLFIKLFSDRIAAILLISIVLGTNYLLHVSIFAQNMMTHNYLFSLYAVFIYYTYKWHLNQKWSFLLIMAISSGLLVLIRPSEIVVFIIPVLWNVSNRKTLAAKFRLLYDIKNQLIIFSLIVFVILSLQLAYNYLCTGTMFYSGYNNLFGDKPEPLNPHFINVLFSFRKGWLVYTPIMCFAIIGFYHLYRYYRQWFWVSLVFFISNLYIVSSWSCWWYADSFSQRALIQSYVLMSIPLGAFLSRMQFFKPIIKVGIFTIGLLLIGLNLFQSWQMSVGILDGKRMTKTAYFKMFRDTQKSEENDQYLLLNRDLIDQCQPFDTIKFKKTDTFLSQLDLPKNSQETSNVELMENKEYSSGIELNFKDITSNEYAWLKISAYIYPTDSIAMNQVFIVMQYKDAGRNTSYRTFDIASESLLINHWNYIETYSLTPDAASGRTVFNTYIWNSGKRSFKLKEFKVDVHNN